MPRAVFREWLRRGEQKKAREPYRGFARAVRQAEAQGRLRAEVAVSKKDPKFWLKYGPGKETLDNPGWTGEAKPLAQEKQQVHAQRDWETLMSTILQALDGHPEARLAVARALMSIKPPKE